MFYFDYLYLVFFEFSLIFDYFRLDLYWTLPECVDERGYRRCYAPTISRHRSAWWSRRSSIEVSARTITAKPDFAAPSP